MGFESGNISFRIYELEEKLDEESVAKFAAEAAPPIETLGNEPIHGWVGPRHLLDRDITPETCVTGEWLSVSLMKAEKKIPPALLKAKCKMAEIERMRETGLPYLNKAMRKEIKEGVVEALQPIMPPTLTSVSCVCSMFGPSAFADAMSEKQQDAFAVNFKKTTGIGAKDVTPAVAAYKFRSIDAETLDRVCFSPDPECAATVDGIGLDFLTWLLYFCEEGGGLFKDSSGEVGAPFGVAIEGPLLFIVEGQGAHKIQLRDGEPMNSAETKTALVGGKKLRSARLTIARGDDVWTATVDASDFSFRNLKLPKTEGMERSQMLVERMRLLRIFTDTFFGLYDKFLKLRADDVEWTATVETMRKWIQNKKANI